MKRVLLSIFLVAPALWPTHGQTTTGQRAGAAQCALTTAQSPSIRGIRLGMSADELLALFPGSRENPQIKSQLEHARRAPNYGLARLNFMVGDYPSSPMFANVMQFDIQLFDERVTSVYVSYGGPPWRDVDEMVARVAESLGLPGPQSWTARSESAKVLRCESFEVGVTAYAANTCCSSIRLHIPSVEQQLRERQAAEEEKARREFRP